MQFHGSHTGSCSTAVTAVKSLNAEGLETKEQVPCGLPDVFEPPINVKCRGIIVKDEVRLNFIAISK